MNVQLDENAAQGASDASHDHIDRQLPYVVPEPRTIQRNAIIVQTQISAYAESSLEYLAWLLVKLRQEVKGTHSCAGGQKASPEQRRAVEGGPLFDGQQKAANRSCK